MFEGLTLQYMLIVSFRLNVQYRPVGIAEYRAPLSAWDMAA